MEGIDTCIPDCPYCRHRPPPLHHFSFSSPPHCPNCLNHWYTFNYGFPATASSAYPYKSPPPESPPPLPPPPPSNLPPEPSKPPPPPHQVRRRRREPTRSRSEIEKACVEHFQKRRVEAKLSKVKIPIGENPAWSDPSLYLMGLQTCIVIIWTAMVIPSTLAEVIGGGNVEKAEAIQMSLFTAAVNTGLQVLFGSQLPVVMQISQAFINAAISIAVSINNKFGDTLTPRQRFEESMRRIQGASIIGSFLQIIIGYSGLVEIFVSKLDLVASIPLVTLTGLELRDRGFPQMMKCTAIGLPALAIMIFSTHLLPMLWKPKKPIISRFAGITISIAVVWTFDEILTVSGVYDNTSPQTQANCRTDRSGLISAAPWIRMPNPFQWGHPTFEVRDVCLVMVASLVATVESIGTFSASSRLGGEIRPRLPKSSRSRQPKSEPDIAAKEKRKNLFIRYVKAKENRSALHISPDTLPPAIGFQGVGTLIDAVFGMGFGCTASVEQTGLTGLTKVGSLRVVFVSAIFMLLLSATGKVSAILASVPLPIAASLYIILSPYLLSSGLKDLHYLDLDRSKLNFILGFSLFVGISTSKYYSSDIFFNQGLPHSRSSWFKDIIQVIFSSAPTTATIVAFIFNLIMPIKSSKKEPKKKELKPKEEEMELRPLWEDWKIYIASRRSWKSTLGIPSHPSH